MKILLQLAVTALLITLFGLACLPETSPGAIQPPSSPTLKVKAEIPDWQRKWEETLAAAKKEGEVMVYGGMLTPPFMQSLSREFEKKHNIGLRFMVGPFAEMPARWDREKSAGINLADVFMVGGWVLHLKPMGAVGSLEPYLILPEVIEGKAWPDGKLPYLDKEKTALPFSTVWTSYIAINTDIVKEGQLKSYKDLLKPEWKGKVVLLDPSIPGAAAGWATFMITEAFGLEGGKEFLRQFAATQPTISRDGRLSLEWVARGRYAIAVGATSLLLRDFISMGAPVAFGRFIEGGSLNPGSEILNVSVKPPHPNATTVFINWLLTAEGQAASARGSGSPPVRLDVKVEGIHPATIARPGDKVFWTDDKFFLTQGEAQKIAKEIFGL